MNVFTAVGRLTADAEQRYTTNQTAVCSFTVASDVGYGDKKHALFIRCSLWGKRGESLVPYLLKGTQVTVSGEADLREWTSGEKSGTSLELRVNDLALQGSRPEAGQSAKPKAQESDDAFDDSVIPF